MELQIPLKLTNVPKNTVIVTEMPDTANITVYDKGFTLLYYLTRYKAKTMSFSFVTYANQGAGKGAVPVADVQKNAYMQLHESTRITAIKPEKFDFYFNFGQSKRVPVVLFGSIKPGESYYLAAKKFMPSTVLVYGSKRLLDSIKYVTTTYLSLSGFTDTVRTQANLRPIRGAKIVPAVSTITLCPDILTEESIEVPITTVNVPDGKALRTFPSRVRVDFTVGASMFRNIKPEQFVVVADYKEITPKSDKCNLYLRAYPHSLVRCKLSINKVDYLLEDQ